MIKYKNILVATDFSAIGQQAASKASDLATLFGANLTILHVVEHFPGIVPESAIPPENIDPEKFFSDQAYAALEKLQNDIGQQEAELEVIISSYSAGREITEYATQKNMDLIVVGSHRKHGFPGMPGSTASRAMHSATIDVLIVHTMD